ncbi:hypothetical protein ABEB36_006530 [Hypothenemus hampei]|uniref:SAGA-associated factor 11 n=1 Tax=Hypothenemus hampei TaxID=57062 RepID=A0ABD1ERK6_HYPHA
MSKRQLSQQEQLPPDLTDLQLTELIEHDKDPNLFDHLLEDFHELMNDKQLLKNCVEKFFDNLVDEFTLGVIFETHRKYKTNAYCLVVNDGTDEDTLIKHEDYQQMKSVQKCGCPNCGHTVAPPKFGWHLAKCMGISDNNRPSRASRRAVTSKDIGDNDDECDEDWGSRKSSKKKDKNGGKKTRGARKKTLDQESLDTINVDIEKGYDEMTNFQYMMDHGRRSYMYDLQERRSSSASPTESSISLTPSKKRNDNQSRRKGRGKDKRRLME